ncbi:PAS domain-containing protein [Vibrio salinus]|uniref:PAS domain-containing protein n=1 Tax=Vibrio salinus TaxID=2899784 RepID=UPI001E369578|nr:PAS domain-containing protein [Vibrio salinus]MCE0495253.1 PAS domain S-box protein [Vibrio salinus]
MITPSPSAKQIHFADDELIISKTDLKGNITYANRIFMQVSNFTTDQLIGQSHSIIRHRDMPKGVFYGLWKTLKSGEEFFGFVKNITADGNFYWVFANITPDFLDGKMVGFFSVRRTATESSLAIIRPLYQEMLAIEQKSASNEAAKRSWEWLLQTFADTSGKSYEEHIISVYEQ